MMTNQAIEVNSAEACRSEKLMSMDYRVQSIAFYLFTRYKSKRILGIGDSDKTLWNDIRHAGSIVSMMQLRTEKLSNLQEDLIVSSSNSKKLFLNSAQGSSGDFDMAISLETNKFFSEPSTVTEAVFLSLRLDGIFILAIPYYSYFELLSISWRRWWNSLSLIYLESPNVNYWLRESVVDNLELNGFKLIESIGVKDNSLQWKTLILVARKFK